MLVRNIFLVRKIFLFPTCNEKKSIHEMHLQKMCNFTAYVLCIRFDPVCVLWGTITATTLNDSIHL